MAPSRGNDVRNYMPAFKKGAMIGFSGNISAGVIKNAHLSAKSITSALIRAAFLSGTIVSGQTTRAIAHGLGVKPKSIVVVPILTLAEAISARVPQVHLAAASAATSANFYVVSSKASNGAVKYQAYIQL